MMDFREEQAEEYTERQKALADDSHEYETFAPYSSSEDVDFQEKFVGGGENYLEVIDDLGNPTTGELAGELDSRDSRCFDNVNKGRVERDVSELMTAGWVSLTMDDRRVSLTEEGRRYLEE